MDYIHCTRQTDHGPKPYVTNVEQMSQQNRYFRSAVWTGRHVQMTVMCIPPCGEIGLEIHEETDQFIRVEQGCALVKMGESKRELDFQQNMCRGDAVFVPAGIWHNVINTGRNPLKVSVIYAPPNHPRGTVHFSKADAEREENLLLYK